MNGRIGYDVEPQYNPAFPVLSKNTMRDASW